VNNGTYILYGGFGFDAATSSSLNVTLQETYYNDVWYFILNNCPGGCNGRGRCSYGYCYCNQGYYGDDCQGDMCSGDGCYYDIRTQQQVCTHCNMNNGTCLNGVCICNQYYRGADCSLLNCPNACTSSQQGTCVLSAQSRLPQCQCNTGYSGTDCSLVNCPSTCNAPLGGFCDTTSGTCQCYASLTGYYRGLTCGQFIATA